MTVVVVVVVVVVGIVCRSRCGGRYRLSSVCVVYLGVVERCVWDQGLGPTPALSVSICHCRLWQLSVPIAISVASVQSPNLGYLRTSFVLQLRACIALSTRFMVPKSPRHQLWLEAGCGWRRHCRHLRPLSLSRHHRCW